MKRFRVAHVITRLCKGGAQENTFHTVRLGNQERFESHLIAGYAGGPEGSIEDAVRAAGIDIIREPALVRNAAPMRDTLALMRLTRLFKRNRYDIVHTHTSKAGFLGRLAAERAGVPIVVHTPHGNIFQGYFSKLQTLMFIWMERHAARRTDRIIELTAGGIEEHLAQDIGQREQYRVIYSGIDFAPYETALRKREETRLALGATPDTYLVGGVGRLERVKGFAYFVQAARLIADKAPQARFFIAGQGSLEDALRGEASSVAERFQFLGLREDVPDLMAAMDLIVVPSLNEGMGRVLLEAAAAATPAVASNVGGIPDIVVDGGTGVLVPSRDASALAEAVISLAKDAERRRGMGELARAMAVPAYSIEHMVEQIEMLYEELIAEKDLDS